MPKKRKQDFEELKRWIRWLQQIGGLRFAAEEKGGEEARIERMIVGLGNPGPEYAETRHNVGFMVVDLLARRWAGRFTPREHALLARVSIHGVPTLLVKPQTFMNASGRAVAPLVRQLGLPPEHLIIVYDDMDLPFGTLRMRAKGSHAGHKGMRSVLEHLGTQAVPRLRIGIGRPPGNMDPADYVLSPFDPEERELLPWILERAVEALERWTRDGLAKAAQWLHSAPALQDEAGAK